jgi:hypothetical protein
MLPCHQIIIVKVKYAADGKRDSTEDNTFHVIETKRQKVRCTVLLLLLLLHKGEESWVGAVYNVVYCTWLGLLLLVLALSSHKLATTVQLQSYHPLVVNKNRLIIIIYRRKVVDDYIRLDQSRLHNKYLLCKLKKKTNIRDSLF